MSRRTIGVATLIALVIFVSVNFLLARQLTKPATAVIGGPPAWLSVESITIPSASGSTLSAWFDLGDPTYAMVVLMHPVRGNRTSMLGRARFLQAAGYGILLFDFQAHGASPGRRITFGHLESLDAQAAVEYATRRAKGRPIVVVGSSLGGASALLAKPGLDVSALVAEAVYPDIATAVSNRLELRFGSVGRSLAPLLLFQLRPHIGVAADSLAPADAARQFSAPALVMVGSNDQRTTREDAETLFANFSGEKELWIVDGARHQDLHAFASLEYEAKLLEFIERSVNAQVGKQ